MSLLLENKYRFDCSKYTIQQTDQNILLISNELFKILCMNETGFYIINALDGNTSVHEIIQSLSTAYGLDVSIISETVERFIIKLLDDGFLKDSSDNSSDVNTAIIERMDRIYVDITDHCNLTCNYCNKDNINENELAPETLTDLLYELQENEVDAVVYIGGGEPLLHSHLLDILKAASRDKKNRIILTSNGIVTGEKWKTGIQEYVSAVMLNIAHIEQEKNDKAMGAEHYNKFIEAVSFYKEFGIPVYMSVTPTIDNLSCLPALQQLAYDLHMNGIYIQNPIMVREGNHKIPSFNFSLQEYHRVKRDLMKTNTFLNSWKNNRLKDSKTQFNLILGEDRCFNNFSNLTSKPHCGILLNEVAINAKGHLYPCHMLCLEQFCMQTVEEYKANKANYETNKITNGKCGDCTYWLLCLGGCRAETYFNTGTLHNLSCSCEQKMAAIDELLHKIASV